MLEYGRMRGLLVFSLAALAGCTSSTTDLTRALPLTLPIPRQAVRVVAYSADGADVLIARTMDRGCSMQLISEAGGEPKAEQTITNCPDLVRGLADGTWFLRTGGASFWYSRNLSLVPDAPSNAIDAFGRTDYVAQSEGRLHWIGATSSRELPPDVTTKLRLLSGSETIVAIVRAETGETLARLDADGTARQLFEPIRRIESFDVSPDGKEIVFSGDRTGNLDVGLVSTSGSDVRWVGPDPAEERSVSWAPRGNKVTWIVETATGALIRTVHIPTAYQLVIDLPFASAESLSWEPRAERFAYVRTSLADGTSVETARYGGDERRTLVPPSGGFGGEPDVLVNAGVAAVAFAPRGLRYGERRPTVVWVVGRTEAEEASRYAISGGAGHVVVTAGEPGPTFWDALAALSWIDPARVFVVDTTGRALLAPGRGVTRVGIAVAATAPPPGAVSESVWGERDKQVLLAPADAARVIPFAAAYVMEKISRSARANGSG